MGWNTQSQKNSFLNSDGKHSPCQLNSAFCWLLSILPWLHSWFKWQDYHSTQAEGGIQTIVLLMLYYHTWSLCRHYKHVRWLWDVSLRTPPSWAASTRTRLSLLFTVRTLSPLTLLALPHAVGQHKTETKTETQRTSVCAGSKQAVSTQMQTLEEFIWN